MDSRWMPAAAMLAFVTLAGCSGRLPRPASNPVEPATERPPIVEQHSSGMAPDSPGTATAPVGAGTLEREPAPEVEAGEVTDPVLDKIRKGLEEQAEQVRKQQ